ncbi:phage major capsid protein [Bradyrhizobium elkanii]|uniref:phage major capsid protein n=1 Tax=Bradyrhizobium elkanii TaxID=29448 RepID=UPI0008418200|nr:phage major capsid protein [Bradyrhizobium elkanii]ODM77787.1 major capsid protein [Bradyrhizobium elkanii]ODM81757.1 major capsid protein [Bradyrhizobium elkanii]
MRKDLKKLRQARAEKAKAGKTKLEALNALLAKGELTEAEAAQLATLEGEVDALEAEVKGLDTEITAEEKAAKRASLFGSTALGGPALATVVNDTDPARTAGFKSLAEFAVSVRNLQVNGVADPRFAAAATGYQQNQGSSGEGILVPTEWREQIWSLVFDDNDLLGFCNPEPTQGNTVGIVKDETTPWGAAGVQAAWRSEGSQMIATKAALTPTIMQLHELYAFVLATQEILDDAPRLQNRILTQAARAIRWKAFEGVVNGDGNGKPLGFMNSQALITVAAEAGQATGTIVTANVLKMMARLFEMPGGSPQWLANRDTIPQLGTMTIGNNAAWLPINQALSGGAIRKGGILLGEQLSFNEHCQTVGTVGDLVLADLSGYALATKQGGGIDFAASIHLYFDQNLTAFRWIFRVGGQPYLSKPIPAAKGNNSKSHFVALATRP